MLLRDLRPLLQLLLLFFIPTIHSEDAEYLLETESLPDNLNFMPTLSNGHLGYTIFGDAIFMNGIYNGHGGNSRRARLPNWLNVSLSSVDTIDMAGSPESPGSPVTPSASAATYALHLQGGYFSWRQTVPTMQLQIEQRSYPHRYYTRALVYELLVSRVSSEAPLTLKLVVKPGEVSKAFNFTPLDASGGFKTLRGVTKSVEHELFQVENRTIFIMFSEDLGAETTLKMAIGQNQLHYRYIITSDEKESVARREMEDILRLSPVEMFRKHTVQWEQFWREEFSIEVQGDLELSQTINAGIFYLSNSLASHRSNQRSLPSCGLSPTGLGRGQLDADYEGHSFWDTEIWMLPVVEQFSPIWAQSLLHYRLHRLPGAKYNANLTGYKGARFPWESAYTGTEVTNPCCPEGAAQQVHISADIVIALSAHYARIHELDWLCQTAWPVAREVATFLSSRVQWDSQTQHFHVNMVMGPDEDHWNVSDNVYTNVAFKRALEFASFVEDTCSDSQSGRNASIWLDIAQKLFILYDHQLDYHPQHVGYQQGVEVKQADVILLGYPMQFAMNTSTRLNDLHAYAGVTRESGPAMTWSMFATNFLDVGDVAQAHLYFDRGYKDYVRPEFKVWSENKRGFDGSANFITGIGGFLQAVINGFAGIRYRHDELTSIMEIEPKSLPPGSSQMTLRGIKFANASFTLKMQAENKKTTLTCLEMGRHKLILRKGRAKYPINKGFIAELGQHGVSIQTVY